MRIRAIIIFPALLIFLLLGTTAQAQGTHKFLGAPREVPDQLTPRFGIRYNTQGYDRPRTKWNKKINKWQKKGVPDSAIQEILEFPGSPDAIGKWIDDAYAKVQNQFMKCGGPLAQRASFVNPSVLRVTIMPSAFYEPYWKINVAGAYYPSTKEIKVLNIYYTWKGENKGWMRHARDLLEWEIGNFFGVETKTQPEPRSAGWPCNAPALK